MDWVFDKIEFARDYFRLKLDSDPNECKCVKK